MAVASLGLRALAVRFGYLLEIRDAEEGRFYARALGHAIFAEGETGMSSARICWKRSPSILKTPLCVLDWSRTLRQR
jgi:hypothetical protein